MKRTREAKRIRLPIASLRQIDAVYATVPGIECKGLCHGACGPIMMSRVEWERIIARLGYRPEPTPEQRTTMRCPMLTADNKCSVYDIRPLICRLYGVAPDMPCPFGCQPERQVYMEESVKMVAAVELASRYKG